MSYQECMAWCGNHWHERQQLQRNDYLSSPLRVISSLLIRRYSERGLSLPRFWSAKRKRKARLRPDLLAAKYTASASTRAQASAAFLEDMRAHCLTVSTNGKHHAGRRPNARSIARPREAHPCKRRGTCCRSETRGRTSCRNRAGSAAAGTTATGRRGVRLRRRRHTHNDIYTQ